MNAFDSFCQTVTGRHKHGFKDSAGDSHLTGWIFNPQISLISLKSLPNYFSCCRTKFLKPGSSTGSFFTALHQTCTGNLNWELRMEFLQQEMHSDMAAFTSGCEESAQPLFVGLTAGLVSSSCRKGQFLNPGTFGCWGSLEALIRWHWPLMFLF